MSWFMVGDRVCAQKSENVGASFRGLAGTVVEVMQETSTSRVYRVRWDSPPSKVQTSDPHGGVWSANTLEREPRPDLTDPDAVERWLTQ